MQKRKSNLIPSFFCNATRRNVFQLCDVLGVGCPFRPVRPVRHINSCVNCINCIASRGALHGTSGLLRLYATHLVIKITAVLSLLLSLPVPQNPFPCQGCIKGPWHGMVPAHWVISPLGFPMINLFSATSIRKEAFSALDPGVWCLDWVHNIVRMDAICWREARRDGVLLL